MCVCGIINPTTGEVHSYLTSFCKEYPLLLPHSHPPQFERYPSYSGNGLNVSGTVLVKESRDESTDNCIDILTLTLTLTYP